MNNVDEIKTASGNQEHKWWPWDHVMELLTCPSYSELEQRTMLALPGLLWILKLSPVNHSNISNISKQLFTAWILVREYHFISVFGPHLDYLTTGSAVLNIGITLEFITRGKAVGHSEPRDAI